MIIVDNPSRPYLTVKRDAKAAETRKRLLEAALALLSTPNAQVISLEAVAKAAGVTRLTVYNQFGSRSGLLEAAFDTLASKGGIERIPRAMAIADPRAALAEIVTAFCDFWCSHDAFAAILAAAVFDAELGAALQARDQRRRDLLGVLVDRTGRAEAPARADVVDQLCMLTSFSTFASLAAPARDRDRVLALLLPLCDRVFVGEKS